MGIDKIIIKRGEPLFDKNGTEMGFGRLEPDGH